MVIMTILSFPITTWVSLLPTIFMPMSYFSTYGKYKRIDNINPDLTINKISSVYLSFFIGYIIIFLITKPVYNIFSVNKKSASINTIIISAICLFLMDTSVFLDNGFDTQKIQQNIFQIVIWCSLLYHFVFKKSDK